MALLDKTDAEIDQYFGLSSALISQSQTEETYADGLTSSEALYTSYKDLETIRKDCEDRGIKSLADLGAGISRMAFFFEEMKSSVEVSTYEIVEERVQTAKQAYASFFKREPRHIYQNDIKVCDFPKRDAYFVYLPVGKTLRKIIHELKKATLGETRYLYVIESHGDLIPFLRDVLPELKLEATYPLTTKRHHPDLHVFSLRRNLDQQDAEIKFIEEKLLKLDKENEILFDKDRLSMAQLIPLLDELEKKEDVQIIIEEEREDLGTTHWIGDILAFENGARPGSLILCQPPRTISLESIVGFFIPEGKMKELIEKRKVAKQKPVPRKIFIRPELILELSDGSLHPIS